MYTSTTQYDIFAWKSQLKNFSCKRMAGLKTINCYSPTQNDLYCRSCNFQFGNKYLIDVHMKIIHAKKNETNKESNSYESNIIENSKADGRTVRREGWNIDVDCPKMNVTGLGKEQVFGLANKHSLQTLLFFKTSLTCIAYITQRFVARF